MRTVQQSISLFASLLLVLLLLLIDICDCVGTNNKMIIMFGMLVNDDINLLIEFVVVSISIRCFKDNYYTINTSIYVQLGDVVDCSII